MTRARSVSLILVSLIAGTDPGSGANAADPISKVKDIRKDKTGPPLYVVFCARDSPEKLPGHAFVILGKDDDEKKVCSIEAFGFQPRDKGDLGVLGPVPGEVAEPYLKDSKKVRPGVCRLILRVDRKQYDRVDALRREWEDRDYRIVTADCVKFTDEAAEALGLNRPGRSGAILPHWFIRQLAEKN